MKYWSDEYGSNGVENKLNGGWAMNEYTKFRNKNRGYMKLEAWHKAIELFKLIWKITYVDSKIDFKLRSQIADAAQSVSSNIAEGYSRRSINEYIQFLYTGLASLSETLTRAIGLKETAQISESQFKQIDSLHYEAENKLINLIASLEAKRNAGTWIDHISDDMPSDSNEQHL
jgi:four helix bundle protein